jgi:hypothetical protein
MRLTLLLATFLLAGACATTGPVASSAEPIAPAGVTYAGGDGLDCKRRVLIRGANFETGVKAEYAWLQAKYPGFRRERQTITDCEGSQSDQLAIVTADGHPLTIYFDISDFLGKGLVR